MTDISLIDKNFAVDKEIDKTGLRFYDAEEAPFEIYGVFREGDCFRRMPEAVAATVSDGVRKLHTKNAGGRVRFATDSARIAVRAKLHAIGKMPHFALTGSAGFDLYADGRYVKSFIPPFTIEGGFESVIELETAERREITINFPLYSGVNYLEIGLAEEAEIWEPKPYRPLKPIVYYGSSITQGGCASRPGRSYQSAIERRLNCDYINLGFSGKAKGEPEMANYIKDLPMSVFVYDYDHNAHRSENLLETHEPFFRTVREANPDLPIVMMNRPKFYLTEAEKERRAIIETTYQNALKAGDKNVYFISNEELCALCADEGTVDGCHPTDYGFASMAQAVGDVLEKILNGLS
ncbi:MAG: SGNH/GDSL hydrolase family protein [Clostridia bacterium]|nr:SGNH/GDSL hydrolase family protein [Clostridia bacterium]